MLIAMLLREGGTERPNMPTVPAYWNHGDGVEFTRHLGMGVAMSASHNPIVAAMPPGAIAVPPFWELEALLDDGMELPGALAVMAARRKAPVLVQPGDEPAQWRMMIAFGSASWKN